ncbi:MAG: winged helix-turn-helix domain-containing protein [Anaerolineae bacterium]
MPTPVTVRREDEIDRILQALRDSHCISIVGLSNMGKSTLIRSLLATDVVDRYTHVANRQAVFIYIDCNGMLELSGQGFYELILRAVQQNIDEVDLLSHVAEHYQKVVEPDSQFMVPFSFNSAMTTVIEEGDRDVIMLLDEFDEAFDSLDARVLLNLRHMKDRYPRNLIYITATVRRLGSRRFDEQTAEFIEMFASATFYLGPLKRAEADELVRGLAAHAGVTDEISEHELDFMWEQTGGHPRLLRAAVSQLAELLHETEASGAPITDNFETVLDYFLHDATIRTECSRLIGQLAPDERQALGQIATGSAEQLSPTMITALLRWGLIEMEEGEPSIFADLLFEFLRRQARVEQEDGLWVDHDAGEVWVEGVSTPALTELEFKLMSLLFERRNKLTDKYQIVETVWGVEYIDEVDDARIEKLVSRLRSKVEPDSGSPRYITTVRGRGYKLITP